MRTTLRAPYALFAVGLLLAAAPQPPRPGTASEKEAKLELVQCANLIYARSKTSHCFSDKFLKELHEITNIDADVQFTPAKLGADEVFNYPFAIMTGEGAFSLFEEERKHLRSYLERGGFLLASAGCSSPEWDRSFRREFKLLFPGQELKKIPMDHAMFRIVYDIKRINLKNGGTTLLEGLEVAGKIVLIYSSEGLNDVASVQG
ncbi:MAG: DUF4159 domain-containing protein, partial [Candidatus Hydrogenedentes bacterium]|nr:DUF4159 domain-containing protein [Candidatus Hydrogenedentota bacterium]